MSDLVKNVLGGAWALVVGWILSVFLTLQLMMWLVAPHLEEIGGQQRFGDGIALQQVGMLAVAAVVGLVLAAMQSPLYRVLEGYLLWPSSLATRRAHYHQRRRAQLIEQFERSTEGSNRIRSGLIYERVARYPAKEAQVAPTMLGNAIRRFETYASDRYQLDSQLLWHHLSVAAPERAVIGVDNARSNVDFFVCLLYGGIATTVLGFAVLIRGGDWALTPAILIGLVVAAASYRFAVLATDEWAAAVRALVDHGKKGVAASFGFSIPTNLTNERLMWRTINTLVRRPYACSEEKGVAELVTQMRQQERDNGDL